MKTREFYNAIVAMNETNPDLAEFAQNALARMDATDAKRAAKRAEKNAADVEITAALLDALTAEPQTALELLTATNAAITPQKVSYLLRQYVNDGTVVKEMIAVPDKKTKVTGYRRA